VAVALRLISALLGDTMAPFVKLARQLNLPQTATLVLQGPELWVLSLSSSRSRSLKFSAVHARRIPFLDEGEEMYQWYTSFTPLAELIDHPNPLPGVRAVHRALEHLTGPACGWAAERVHLFGFAQGGSVALEAALRWAGGVGSAVSIGGGLVEVATRAGAGAATKVLYVGDEAGAVGLSKGFASARVEATVGREVRMPRGRDEWSVVMRFWSEVLERRGPEGEGIHRVLV
jgi:predicted esterase